MHFELSFLHFTLTELSKYDIGRSGHFFVFVASGGVVVVEDCSVVSVSFTQ